MIPVAFDNEEEAEFCPEDIAATGLTTPFFDHLHGCHVSASVQFLELSAGYSGSSQVGLLYSRNNFLKPVLTYADYSY